MPSLCDIEELKRVEIDREKPMRYLRGWNLEALLTSLD